MNPQDGESGSTSFYSSEIYEYDFVTGELVEASSIFSIPKRTLVSILETSSAVAVGSARVSWEFVTFLVSFSLFTQRKLVSLAYWLESLKDMAVRVLMWKRGLLFKPTIHGSVLAIASVALVVGGLFVSNVEPKDFTRDSVLAVANTTETIIPDDRPRSEVIKHKVLKGETLSHLANKFNVSVASIQWANDLNEDDNIKSGDSLSIPPISGVVHNIKSGETLASLSKKYKADAQTVADYPFNYLTDSLALTAGQTLYLPGGKIPEPTPLPTVPGYSPSSAPVFYAAGGSGIFSWPVKGSLNQSPSWWHPAIDIGASYGSPVIASAAGTITASTWGSYGYGNYIFIDHGNGYKTTYAHLGSLRVSQGQKVGRGQLIGTVGCTGYCTGPHVHYEVRRSGQYVNPLSLLP